MNEAETPDVPSADNLSSELRHRLANIFQLLSTLTRMRIQRSGNEEARRQLSWILDATSVLALLNNRPAGVEGADFSRILHDMAPLWRRRCEGRPIVIELDLAPLTVPERHESALALIAHELVINAIAHGFPKARDGDGGDRVVKISFGPRDGQGGALAVRDTGRGYDPAAVDRTRLGLWLIQGLASQVQGVLTTGFEPGVHARLVFPLPTS